MRFFLVQDEWELNRYRIVKAYSIDEAIEKLNIKVSYSSKRLYENFGCVEFLDELGLPLQTLYIKEISFDDDIVIISPNFFG